MRALLLAIVMPLFVVAAAGSAPVVGGDADQHGCRASAGYVWCYRTDECERPWELAQSNGFENSEEAFIEFCEGENGSLLLQWCASAGNAWCEKSGRCESVEKLAQAENFEPTPRAFKSYCEGR